MKSSRLLGLCAKILLVQQVLRRALSGLRLQAVAAWLESHVKFRLSILLTYIFGEVTDPCSD